MKRKIILISLLLLIFSAQYAYPQRKEIGQPHQNTIKEFIVY
jgi:hypothetical protein